MVQFGDITSVSSEEEEEEREMEAGKRRRRRREMMVTGVGGGAISLVRNDTRALLMAGNMGPWP